MEEVAAVSELVDVSQCSWQVEKERETTARIVAWRHLNVTTSSTLECSLAGSDRSSLNVTNRILKNHSVLWLLRLARARVQQPHSTIIIDRHDLSWLLLLSRSGITPSNSTLIVYFIVEYQMR